MSVEELRKSVIRDLRDLREKTSISLNPCREAITQTARNHPEAIIQLLHLWLIPPSGGTKRAGRSPGQCTIIPRLAC